MQNKINKFLPISRKEMKERDWDELDVILISGDAYVDHPAFGAAVIGRLLESIGLKVGIVPQPNWQDDGRDFRKLGKPRLFFGVTAGNMDSMVNHYTANRRLRSDDAYTPGGEAGFRPDRASVVYTQKLKEFFPDTPVVLGGIEGSLRRVTHYDYWDNELKPSILPWSGADLLLYGMGEKPLLELVRLLQKGVPFHSIDTLAQSVVYREKVPQNKKWQDRELHAHEECLENPKAFAENFKWIERESNRMKADRLLQEYQGKWLIVNPPYPALKKGELDRSFDLDFIRAPHFRYKKRGAIPAWDMIKFSVNLHRGCFGGCSFCTISAHQGKFVSSRSEKSILQELKEIVQMPDFKGHISDLGGPSANMFQMQGFDEELCASCSRPSCIFPQICKNLNTDHEPLLKLYHKASQIAGIKKITIGSGLRYDLFLRKDVTEEESHQQEYLQTLIKKHVSGRLKVAPEHTEERVLKTMRKPPFKLFYELEKQFRKINEQNDLKQQLIPYFISSHPKSSVQDMKALADKTRQLGYRLEQVQDFTPTPMTLATVMYYSGYDPYSLEKVYTARSAKEKQEQREQFFWYKKKTKKRN
jgi:uncharacterized radical SAM protein YgiQ